LMEADERPEEAMEIIRAIEARINRGAFNSARRAIAAAKKMGLDLPEWSVLEARIARLELLAK
jgi:hypothetical protein